MLRKKTLKALAIGLAFLLVGTTLASCGEETSSLVGPEDPDALVETPVTDSLDFEYKDQLEGKDFRQADAKGIVYGEVHLMNVTDGDTVSWKTELGTLDPAESLRLEGVDTPESTANVNPWGVKASRFAKEVLTNAHRWAIINDVPENFQDTNCYDRFDSNGTRYMGFLWYQPEEGAAWRLFNLELVEQGYSPNRLFHDSELGYLPYFLEAQERAEQMKLRVNGTADPDYDYSDDVVETTIWYLRENYDELGINMESGSSGSQLRLTALVVGLIGDNLVLRDIVRSGENADGEYKSIYAYAGYNTSLGSIVSVGDVIRFYCRATKFPAESDTIQLSDLKTSQYDLEQPFEILSRMGDENWSEYIAEDNGIDPIDLTGENTPASKEELGERAGAYVTAEVEVRMAMRGDYDDDGQLIGDGVESHFNEGKSGITIYGYLRGTRIICNLRIDKNDLMHLMASDFQVGDIWRVDAYLNPYYDNYQLAMLNYDNGAHSEEIFDAGSAETGETL